jgi:hypothetical protein
MDREEVEKKCEIAGDSSFPPVDRSESGELIVAVASIPAFFRHTRVLVHKARGSRRLAAKREGQRRSASPRPFTSVFASAACD